MNRTGKLLKAYGSLFRVRVVESFQYRASALSGIVTSMVWAVVEVVAFSVFYQYGAGTGGLTLSQTVSHVWVRELLLIFQTYSIDGELLSKITSGDVALDMCRPLDLYWHWFSRSSAEKVVGFFFRCVPSFLLGFLIPGGYGARPPASIEGFFLFLPSVLCAFLLCSAYGMLAAAVRVNITWGNGPMYMMMLLAQALSGGILPLQLWPDAIQPLLLLQPFAGLIDIPARLYIGSMAVSHAWLGMSVQLLWTGIFILLGKWVMTRRLSTIVAQGG